MTEKNQVAEVLVVGTLAEYNVDMVALLDFRTQWFHEFDFHTVASPTMVGTVVLRLRKA